MRFNGKSTRFYERTKLEVPVEITYAENEDAAWTENTLTEELTICGAGFTLSRPVYPKHLVKLRLAMPKSLRLFDFGKEIYEVWGIITSVQIVRTENPQQVRFKIGAALIGANPPPGFLRDPATLYDLNPILRRQGFWNFRELPRNRGRFARALTNRRKLKNVVILETLNNYGQIIESVRAVTEDISEGGMALNAKLTKGCTEYVIIRSKDEPVSLLAKVHRAHASDEEGNLKIHLEFISGEWLI